MYPSASTRPPQLLTDRWRRTLNPPFTEVDATYYTDIGLLNITFGTSQVATFTVSGGSPSSVPEIDPNSLGSILALVAGALGLLERHRLKAA
jgi:hypothetical protein